MNGPGTRSGRSPDAGRFDADPATLLLIAVGRAHRVRADHRPSQPSMDAASCPTGQHAPDELPCQIHDPDLWFADAPADLERAKALCAGCPARLACLAGAVRRREPVGVWGGQIFDRGRIVTYKRARGRPRKGCGPPRRYAVPADTSVAHDPTLLPAWDDSADQGGTSDLPRA